MTVKERVDSIRRLSFQAGALLALGFLIAGCGGSVSTGTGTGGSQGSGQLKGRIRGGQFPVVGATIQIYTVGSNGYGVGAQAMLSPAATTDANGDFNIPASDISCSSNSNLTYLVATGGDPGTGSNNPAIGLMAALGQCGDINSISFVNVNEVTTVASVWALAPFLGYGAQVGTSSTNATGLKNAFANVKNLTDITQGTTPGPSQPAGSTIPTAKLYTLANILASCVNSSGATACDELFSAATPSGGTAPTNTIDAALNIARSPATKVSTLYSLAGPTPPFGSGLTSVPNDWLLEVTYVGGGLDRPTSIAVDGPGNVWTANYCGSSSPCSSVTELAPNGDPVSTSSGFTDGTLWENYGLAIDSSNRVWVTNLETSSSNSGRGSLAELNTSGSVISPAGGYISGGIDFPVAVAIDTNGNVWTANEGDSTASLMSTGGTAQSPSTGWGSGDGMAGPEAVAIDANHNAWFANYEADSGSVTCISSSGSSIATISSGGFQPSGIAVDSIGVSADTSQGHAWTANYGTSSVSELTLTGTCTANVDSTGYTSGGLNHPNGIAVDGAGAVWVTNYEGNSITELPGASAASPGQAISPSSGFGTDASLSEPYGIAIDSSGNLWVSNFGLSTVTQFVGAAMPVKTPRLGPPQLP
jgi:sugar lactone lactonase YvrE